MLVDLGRNDVGKVSKSRCGGSDKIYAGGKNIPKVMHIMSDVKGILRARISPRWTR